MSEALQAVYLVHRRSEHDYREWIVLPTTGQVPVNVWTRYVPREHARPVWRGSRRQPQAIAERRAEQSVMSIETLRSTISGHLRQNERNPGGRQWVWDEPIVVEVTPDEVADAISKTPYPVLRRIERVRRRRANAAAS